MAIQSYKELTVWSEGIVLVEQIYQVCNRFPKHEMYGLASQMQRAAVSVPSNIAEGHQRGSTREFLQFIGIALGSLAELQTQTIIAQKLNYLAAGQADSLGKHMDKLGKMLRSLQRHLKAKL